MRSLPWRPVLTGGVGLSVARVVLGLEAPTLGLIAAGFVYVVATSARVNPGLRARPRRLLIAGAILALFDSVGHAMHGLLVGERHPTPSPTDAVAFIA